MHRGGTRAARGGAPARGTAPCRRGPRRARDPAITKRKPSAQPVAPARDEQQVGVLPVVEDRRLGPACRRSAAGARAARPARAAGRRSGITSRVKREYAATSPGSITTVGPDPGEPERPDEVHAADHARDPGLAHRAPSASSSSSTRSATRSQLEPLEHGAARRLAHPRRQVGVGDDLLERVREPRRRRCGGTTRPVTPSATAFGGRPTSLVTTARAHRRREVDDAALVAGQIRRRDHPRAGERRRDVGDRHVPVDHLDPVAVAARPARTTSGSQSSGAGVPATVSRADGRRRTSSSNASMRTASPLTLRQSPKNRIALLGAGRRRRRRRRSARRRAGSPPPAPGPTPPRTRPGCARRGRARGRSAGTRAAAARSVERRGVVELVASAAVEGAHVVGDPHEQRAAAGSRSSAASPARPAAARCRRRG